MIRIILLACILAGVAQGAGAFDRDAGWGIGGDACRAVVGREAEAEAWIAGYRWALDEMSRGRQVPQTSQVPQTAPVPQASLGFNAVKEFCQRHPERSLVAAARAVFRPRRR